MERREDRADDHRRAASGTRPGDKATLIQITAWERRRHAEKARIKWMFTVDRAREKLGRVYPQPAGRTRAAA